MIASHLTPATARILVVDDDAAVGQVALRHLRNAGYQRASWVATGRDAMREMTTSQNRNPAALQPVDLLLLDVTLALTDSYPDGCALAQVVLRQWPGIRLLFLSGYYPEDLMTHCPADLPLVLKPYDHAALAERVADLLRSPPYRWPEPWP